VKRLLGSGLLVAALSLPVLVFAQPPSPAPPAAAPSHPAPAAQDEFVPVNQLPPTEQLPAGPLLLGAYGFIWAAVLVYVWSLSRRLTAVRKDFESLTRRRG
jgi:CcmD family protein